MNPVEEFIGLTKEALSPAAKAAVTMGAISAGTTVAAAVGTAQLQSGIQSAHDTVTRSIAFKKMMRDNPQLQKMDGKQARRYFNTLYNTAPELGKDPFAAGSWVQKVHEYDYVDPQSLKTLADTGARIRERRTDSMVPAFQLAQGSTQAGLSEYSRLDNEARIEARDKAKQRMDIAKSIAGSGFGLIGDMAKSRSEQQRRYEDQSFRLGQESRKAQRDEWLATDSPKARGVRSPDDYEKYKRDMAIGQAARGQRRPPSFQQGISPKPFPGGGSSPFTGYGGRGVTTEEPGPISVSGMKDALKRMFKR